MDYFVVISISQLGKIGGTQVRINPYTYSGLVSLPYHYVANPNPDRPWEQKGVEAEKVYLAALFKARTFWANTYRNNDQSPITVDFFNFWSSN